MIAPRLAVAAMALLLAGSANAMTAACGVVLTNVASATYSINFDRSAGVGANNNGTAMVVVANPVALLWKTASTTVQAPGGAVQFCISFDNQSDCTSAFNVVITDRVPDNMRFMSVDLMNDPWDGQIFNTWSTALTGQPWTAGNPPAGQGPVGSVYLRWSLPMQGMWESGIVCYTVTIL